jgi:hypothetical protein
VVAAAPPKTVAPPRPATAQGSHKALGIVVDVCVVLLLLVGGAVVGEIVAGKSTREVIDGMSGPKFPQLDLLIWLAPPVLFVLVYTLLGSRGKTVGAWLRRRTS